MHRRIERCRICGNPEMIDVLDLGTQTLTGIFPKTRSQQITAGPLQLAKCVSDESACGLLQLRHTYDLNELYGENYGYRSGLNSSMVSHLHRSVGRILEEMPPERGSLVIDVGANDSTTLQAFPKDMYTLVGIDPTASKFKSFYPEHIRLISDFFSKAIVERHLGSRKAGLITSFSMFYDLEEPLTFMREVADVLDDNGIWMFEQSYMPTMLRNNSYDTVCHEHLEYYALKQITWMANRVGLKLLDIEFNDTNGGSVAVIAAKKSSERIECPQLAKYLEAEAQDGLDTVRPYLAFTDRVQKTKEVLRKFLDSARSAGKSVVALGASTKGNVLLQYCGVTAADVSCVGDVNPDKFGSFTPGTLLPIVSEDEALAMRADYYLVLPWHFRPFFLQSPKFAGRNLLFPLPEFEVVSPG